MSSLPMTAPDTPTWLKATASLGVLWYAFGLMQWALGITMDIPAAIASGTITEAHGAAITATPLLAWAAYFLASSAGLAGAALLFVGNPLAKPAFALSLASAGAYYLWIYALSGTATARPSEEGIIAMVVLAVTLAFTLISRRASHI